MKNSDAAYHGVMQYLQGQMAALGFLSLDGFNDSPDIGYRDVMDLLHRAADHYRKLAYPSGQRKLRARLVYENNADTLHLSVRDVKAVERLPTPEGLELEFAEKDSRPCAVKIIGYHLHRWESRTEELSVAIARHLPLKQQQVYEILSGLAEAEQDLRRMAGEDSDDTN